MMALTALPKLESFSIPPTATPPMPPANISPIERTVDTPIGLSSRSTQQTRRQGPDRARRKLRSNSTYSRFPCEQRGASSHGLKHNLKKPQQKVKNGH